MKSRSDFEREDQEEWRELGFYYDRNDEKKSWNLYGDKLGLNNLCNIIEEYVSAKENESVSEHEHLGPHQYFKIVTWSEPMITNQGIFGSFADLRSFAEMLKSRLAPANENDHFTIGNEFSETGGYNIICHIMPDGFDPASLDNATWQ